MRPTELSKFLSFVLRHEPQAIGLVLDANGWARVDELIGKAEAAGKHFDFAALREVVATSEKKRFTLSDDGMRIRAAQGHSVEVDLALLPVAPPPALYHGTASRFLVSIRAEGLRPGSRRHVHLSADVATARSVGRRHGSPVVLVLDVPTLVAEGQKFYRAENGVWLTDPVPAAHLCELPAEQASSS